MPVCALAAEQAENADFLLGVVITFAMNFYGDVNDEFLPSALEILVAIVDFALDMRAWISTDQGPHGPSAGGVPPKQAVSDVLAHCFERLATIAEQWAGARRVLKDPLLRSGVLLEWLQRMHRLEARSATSLLCLSLALLPPTDDAVAGRAPTELSMIKPSLAAKVREQSFSALPVLINRHHTPCLLVSHNEHQPVHFTGNSPLGTLCGVSGCCGVAYVCSNQVPCPSGW
jgi:hypothetical protein